MKLTDADNAADGIFFPALEQNMMGAVLINENDEVMFFNPAAEKLWGYKREEVIGNNIDMLIPRDLRPAHLTSRKSSQKRVNCTASKPLRAGTIPSMVMCPLHGLFLSQKRLVKSKILGAGSSRKLAVS